MNKKEMAALFRGIADWLDTANTEDLRRLTNGEAKFALSRGKDRPAIDRQTPDQKYNLETIRARIERATSLEEGIKILQEEGIDKRKKPLEELGRAYQLGIRNSESMADLAHRIISAVVGSRLHAEITRELPLGR